ncbi:MAG TPA: Hsp20/alpha crystallin family protein [Candidatus Limnocylindria bacterium]|jgi:HSP20 family protein|nr:Hsp20/alpha crystallin family protein [Candidatus Limnocylindria bacterium]
MTIARFSPMTDIVSLRDAMDRLFEESFIRPNTWTGLAAGQVAVPVDLWETKDAYHLRADLPGVSSEQLEINATSDSLSISGEVKSQTDVTEDGWLRQERRVGKFQRAFTLPVAIDPTKVEATFENGVLTLVLPKAENTKPRTIKVNATNSK